MSTDSHHGDGEKSLFGRLTDFLSEDVPDKTSPPPPPPSAAATSASAPALRQPLTTAAADPAIEQTEIFKTLESDVMGLNTPYTALLTQADTLREFITDDSKRLRAAAKTQKVSAPEIQNAINTHLQALDQAGQRFALAVDEQVADKISNKEAEIRRTSDDVEVKRKQLAALQADITAGGEKVSRLRQDIEAQRSRIETRKAQFTAAVDAIRTRLKQALENINHSLGA